MNKYFEPHYKILDDLKNQKGLVQMGPMASYTWNTDPKRLLFVLSRYKFVAKILEGSSNVIEIGCGDGFASRIVKQHVKKLLLTDADPRMISYASRCQNSDFGIKLKVHNFAENKLIFTKPRFDGGYLLDVIEHVPKTKELAFLKNIKNILTKSGILIIGTPSIEFQKYASVGSRRGHINCKTQCDLKKTAKQIFRNVVCFGMNDEIVHTGFSKMNSYNFIICSD